MTTIIKALLVGAGALTLAHASAFAQGHDGMAHSHVDHGAKQHAEHQAHDHDHADAADTEASVLPDDVEAPTITIRVKGMVCDFCARSLTKVLKRDENVAAVAISLEDKTVRISLSEGGTMDDAAVEKAVRSAGYNVASIDRAS